MQHRKGMLAWIHQLDGVLAKHFGQRYPIDLGLAMTWYFPLETHVPR
jgi:hypothetical protein